MAEGDIFESDFNLVTTKKAAAITTHSDEAQLKVDSLERKLAGWAENWRKEVDELVGCVTNIRELHDKQPTILSMRQRLIEERMMTENKIVRLVGIISRQAAKLRGDWQTGGMKYNEQNAKLKGENSYHEEKRSLLQNHVDFCSSTIDTIDHIEYFLKHKVSYDEQHKLGR